jgi:hypothetical protein
LKLSALGLSLRIPGLKISETRPNLQKKIKNHNCNFKKKNQSAEENLLNSFQNMSLALDLTSTSISKIYLKIGTGET